MYIAHLRPTVATPAALPPKTMAFELWSPNPISSPYLKWLKILSRWIYWTSARHFQWLLFYSQAHATKCSKCSGDQILHVTEKFKTRFTGQDSEKTCFSELISGHGPDCSRDAPLHKLICLQRPTSKNSKQMPSSGFIYRTEKSVHWIFLQHFEKTRHFFTSKNVMILFFIQKINFSKTIALYGCFWPHGWRLLRRLPACLLCMACALKLECWNFLWRIWS